MTDLLDKYMSETRKVADLTVALSTLRECYADLGTKAPDSDAELIVAAALSLRRLHGDGVALRAQLAERDDEIKRLEAKSEGLFREMVTIVSETASLRAEIVALEAKLAETRAEIKQLRDLVSRAVVGARNASATERSRWSVVCDVFSVGSGRGISLCREFGSDPDESLMGDGEIEQLREACRDLSARKEGEQTCSVCDRPCYECDATPVGYLCSRCAPSEELERLREVEKAARGLFSAMDYVLPSWREDTLSIEDPKNKDEVNESWDALAAALGEK